MEYQVKVYQTHAGKKPFDSWLNSLKDKKIQVAIDLRLERVRLGNLGQTGLLVMVCMS